MIEELPQFTADTTAEEYHAAPGLSSGALKEFLRSPAHYLAFKSQPRKPTPAMIFGTLMHAAILEPIEFEARIVRIPADAPTRQSNAGKAWWVDFEAALGSRIAVSQRDYTRLHHIAAAARDHPAVQTLLAECGVEQSIAWRDGGVVCRARPDAMAASLSHVVDIKSTTDASRDAFSRSIHSYGYHIQAGFYRRGVYAHGGAMPQWYWLAIETEEPFAVAVYRAPEKMLGFADHLIDEALPRFRKCREENYWPGYDPAIRDIDLPRWAYRVDSDAEIF